MRSLAAGILAALLVVGCGSSFSPSAIGLRQEPAEGESRRYVHRDSGVGVVMPAAATEGEREQDESGFERVVLSTHEGDALYRVVILRPIDGTHVEPASAITRLSEGLIEGRTPSRDEGVMVGDHAARRISLPGANRSGDEVAFLVTADEDALVMLERVGHTGQDARADAFFATLELGCDR